MYLNDESIWKDAIQPVLYVFDISQINVLSATKHHGKLTRRKIQLSLRQLIQECEETSCITGAAYVSAKEQKQSSYIQMLPATPTVRPPPEYASRRFLTCRPLSRVDQFHSLVQHNHGGKAIWLSSASGRASALDTMLSALRQSSTQLRLAVECCHMPTDSSIQWQ